MTEKDAAGAFDAPFPNDAFAPPPGAGPARRPFEGVLRIAGGTLAASDAAVFGHFAMDGRPERFPAVALASRRTATSFCLWSAASSAGPTRRATGI